jgi:Protein of unknown function (DUF3307)
MLSIWLIALHMLGDYILQTNWMAANKFKSAGVRTIHVLCYTAPLAAFAYIWLKFNHLPETTNVFGILKYHGIKRWLAFVYGVFVLHWITDCRRWASDKPWCAKPIMVDQTLHMLQLAALSTLLV